MSNPDIDSLAAALEAGDVPGDSVRLWIVGRMDHIPDGSKWPGPYPEQREPQPEQFLAEWQVVTARQEKNLKNCVVLQEALRVQREVDLAKQEERAEELRYLFNKLTSNPCAGQEELAFHLVQLEVLTKATIAASAADKKAASAANEKRNTLVELVAKVAEDHAGLLHLLTCALQLAAATAGKTQPTFEISALVDGGAFTSPELLGGAVYGAYGQSESSAVKHAPVGGEEEDLDLTEQHRDRARREEQLRIQLWAAPGGPRLRGPPARRRGRLRPSLGGGRHRWRQRLRLGARGAAQGRRRGCPRGESLGGGMGEEGDQGGGGGAAREEAQGSREQGRSEQGSREQGWKGSAGGTAVEEGAGLRRVASDVATATSRGRHCRLRRRVGRPRRHYCRRLLCRCRHHRRYSTE